MSSISKNLEKHMKNTEKWLNCINTILFSFIKKIVIYLSTSRKNGFSECIEFYDISSFKCPIVYEKPHEYHCLDDFSIDFTTAPALILFTVLHMMIQNNKSQKINSSSNL